MRWAQRGTGVLRFGIVSIFFGVIILVAFFGKGHLFHLAQADTPAWTDSLPTYKLRARVTTANGQPVDDQSFNFLYGGDSSHIGPVKAKNSDWSDWFDITHAVMKDELTEYPNTSLADIAKLPGTHVPLIAHLFVQDDHASTPTGLPLEVQVEVKFDDNGQVVPLNGTLGEKIQSTNLPGLRLQIMVSRNAQNAPEADTMTTYNARYWKAIDSAAVPESSRPKKFIIADRYIGGDDDALEWRDGISHLAKTGINTITAPASRSVRDYLLQSGLHRVTGAVYAPPGYNFDYTDPARTPDKPFTAQEIADWAETQAKQYLDAGYQTKDIALFALADEPGWYYPKSFTTMLQSPPAMQRFHDYLKAQNLSPADLGVASLNDAKPIGQNDAHDLPSKRLFYWTTRFFSYDSSQHYATTTKALQKSVYNDVPLFVNWNLPNGRYYIPGSGLNNEDKTGANAATGGHDWFEFAKLGGNTALWSEDWFGDSASYLWSYYMAQFRSAAAKMGQSYGGYLIPSADSTADYGENGMVQKALSIVGNGGKAIYYYMFGPEYNFPGNAYTDVGTETPVEAKKIPQMARANQIIGAGEDLLWPGKPPTPQIGIVMPRSSEAWDNARNEAAGDGKFFNQDTVDYFAEVHDIYLAFQHANIPVNFVDEDNLNSQDLAAYKVLYLTEPNVPNEGQSALGEWVKNGGTLVTVTNAASHDRYNESSSVLADAIGVHEQDHPGLKIQSLVNLTEVGTATTPYGDISVIGERGTFQNVDGAVRAKFNDGTSAVIERSVGKGHVVAFAFMPGLSYAYSSSDLRSLNLITYLTHTGTTDRFPVGFSDALRSLIIYPTKLTGITPLVDVDHTYVEAPLLLSSQGAAVTVLNWTGQSLSQLTIKARLPFTPKRVESVVLDKSVDFHMEGTAAVVTIPVTHGADVLKYDP